MWVLVVDRHQKHVSEQKIRQLSLGLGFCAAGPARPPSSLSPHAACVSSPPQVPGGLTVWQQRETSSGRGLSFQSTVQKGQLHCLQHSEK